MKHSFGSDNHSGVHPQILKAIENVNADYSLSYSEDDYSQRVLHSIEHLLGDSCSAFFVLNGTGANILSLSCLADSSNSIICASTAHINTDECGAPEKFIGCKVTPVNHINGKIYPDEVQKYLTGFGFQHHSQPKVISISQPTEFGTVYTVEEIKQLSSLIHSFGGYLHMDGSRLANAASSLNLSFKQITNDSGVDALSFGGTKNGLLIGEVVVFFSNVNTSKTLYFRKQMTQLYSKSRFIAAQFEEYLKGNLCLSMASHSNSMAKYLENRLKEIDYIKISRPVETNAVFAYIPKTKYEKISKKHFFYIWDEQTMEVRWMCSFNTQKNNIDDFINDLKEL